MELCLIGCGVIGNALKCWLEVNRKDIKLHISDPAKGYLCNITNERITAYFVQLHVPTVNSKQEISGLVQVIKQLPKNKDIWVRTTILPSTLKLLKSINPLVHFMPEFLSGRTSVEDFATQKLVFTGNVELLKKIFVGRDFIQMTSKEACLAKYAHNVFGCLKVTYFNCIYEICKHHNVEYSKVLLGILASGYINSTHTNVPGNDGKFGYGGKCFPKDIVAMKEEFSSQKICKLLVDTIELNSSFRQ